MNKQTQNIIYSFERELEEGTFHWENGNVNWDKVKSWPGENYTPNTEVQKKEGTKIKGTKPCRKRIRE